MNLNQLRAFMAVVQKGTFSAAARQVGISQPAVSLQIQALEEDLGVHLLDRGARQVRLTEAGEVFYPTAVRIVSEIEKVRRRLDELGEKVRGRLSVGGSTIPGQYILPRLLGLFRKEYPEVIVSLRIADTGAIVDAVAAGELQVGLVGARLGSEHLNTEPFAADELVLVVSHDHPLAALDHIDIERLKEADFILREKGSGTRHAMAEYLAGRGVKVDELNVVMELGSTETVVSAVEAGLGISMVSKWAVEKSLELGLVKTVLLPGLPIRRELYLVYRKGAPTRVTEAFLSFARVANLPIR